MARKKKKSEFLQSANKMQKIMQALVKAVLAKGGKDEDLNRLLTDPALASKVAEVIMDSTPDDSQTYEVEIDNDKTLAEMIALGNYDLVNPDITEKHFPSQYSGKREVELELVHLNIPITVRESFSQLNSEEVEQATIEQLLLFGATFPKIQLEFPIIALGSVWDNGRGYCFYPFLGRTKAGGRELGLICRLNEATFAPDCHFLVFYK